MLRNDCTVLFLTGLLAAEAVGLAGDPAIRLAPEQGVLLLKNGDVLHGKITAAGDYFHVLVPNGHLRVKAADIEMQCVDLDEGYRRKRAKIERGKAADHLDLADWCVKHKLFEQAAAELAVAGPGQARSKQIAARLEQARFDAQLPHVPARAVDQGPTNDDLDRMVRGMPQGAVRAFTHTIQPLLLNNCTARGCHTPASGGKLRLQRIAMPSRRTTQRNLHFVLQCVNANDPLASRLLKVPLEAHANSKGAIFSSRDGEQYRQLVIWVQRLSAHSPNPPSARDESTSQPAATTPKESKTARPGEALREAGAQPANDAAEPADKTPPPQMDDEMPALDLPDDAAPAEAPAAPSYTPVDPFDPEIFNRRYFPLRPEAR